MIEMHGSHSFIGISYAWQVDNENDKFEMVHKI